MGTFVWFLYDSVSYSSGEDLSICCRYFATYGIIMDRIHQSFHWNLLRFVAISPTPVLGDHLYDFHVLVSIYYLLGSIHTAIIPFCWFYMLFWLVPSFLPYTTLILYYFLVYLVCATAFMCYVVPYNSLSAEISPHYDERTKLSTYRLVSL